MARARGAMRSGPVPTMRAGDEPPSGRTADPWIWIVVWGTILRGGFIVEEVTAFDCDEALVLAGERRPDLPRPRVAFLAGGQPCP